MKALTLAALAALMTGAAFAQEGGPRIGEIVWPDIDSYCSFMRADHNFVYDDPSSWRWVLFTNFPVDETDTIEAPFMRIDDQLRQLAQTEVQEIDGGVVRIYRSHDVDPYRVELTMMDGEQGSESAGYSGTIKVSRSGNSSEIAYQGDCGV
ncbi:hypothetical protein OEG84_14435 [Hoeflea sp. G2-23]|uniref:Uncharacterized protein n=1 Tax=Hoeflea algicola TaxID=2983763 RepID=A0ABT3ZAQ8_9HYPH|nr:hypothetical protein [Hoeflea algicola]MCY0148865.1 hypothetical protein [Hoeflea algicola]